MKNLIIASLMVASAASYGAMAANYCSSGVIETNVIIDSVNPGGSDMVNGCAIAPMCALTYQTVSSYPSRVGTATMRIAGSTFGHDARLLIVGKPVGTTGVENDTAVNIIINRNTFLENSMLYIRGVFSPDTVISVTGNNFKFGYPLVHLFPDPPGRTEDLASAIYVHDLALLANGALRIDGNTIVGDHNNTFGFVAINAINFGGVVQLNGAKAEVDITNNDIDITCNATSSFGMAVGGSRVLQMNAADTRFSIDGNRVKSIGSSSVFRLPDTLVTGGGMASISNNVVFANTVGMAPLAGDYRPVIRVGALNVGNKPMNTWVSNNTIDVTGPLAAIGVDGDLTCGEDCALYIVKNKVRATGGNPAVQLNGRADLSRTGALWVSANELSRTDADSSASAVRFAKSLNLNDAATVSIDSNVFNARAPALMVELATAAQTDFVRDADARLYVCSNQFGGEAVDTVAKVKASTSAEVGNAAVVEDCIATTALTAATTTLPTTEETSTVSNGTESSTSSSSPSTTVVDGNVTTTSTTTTATGLVMSEPVYSVGLCFLL